MKPRDSRLFLGPQAFPSFKRSRVSLDRVTRNGSTGSGASPRVARRVGRKEQLDRELVERRLEQLGELILYQGATSAGDG